jgi:aarF domain-containing kinase
MEWVDGQSPTQLLSKSAGGGRSTASSRARILSMVRMGIQCSLTQLLVTGVMHGDPHSGNLLLARDGRLCYLDFGMLVR